MMSKNSIVPFLKDYLIKFLTRPFLLDTIDNIYKISSAAVFVWPVVCYILLYNKPESGTQRPVGIAGKAKMAEKR